jgi:hypothetical protein
MRGSRWARVGRSEQIIDDGSVADFHNVVEDRVELWRRSDVDPPGR